MSNSVDLENPDLVDVERQLSSGTSNVVFFVGAGLSKPSGYPLWNELLLDMIDFGLRTGRMTPSQADLARQLIDKGKYLQCGSVLRQDLGERLGERLRQVFAEPKRPVPNIYDRLVRIPCAGFITTNYDALIETSYARVHKKLIQVVVPSTPSSLPAVINHDRQFVLKLHGDVTSGQFALSSEDYTAIQNNGPLSRFLYSVYTQHKIVFLGYGLTDSDILDPLKLIASDFKGQANRHVALIPKRAADRLRIELEDQMSVNVVSYDPVANHEAIETVLTHWYRNRQIATVHVADESNREEFREEYGRLLQRRDGTLIRHMRSAAERAADWISACPVRWGPTPAAQPRMANIAEALIAFHSANRVIQKEIDIKAALESLLTFRHESGGLTSATFGAPSVHPTAIGSYALSLHEDRGAEIVETHHAAVTWLRTQMQDCGGWGTFGKTGKIRVIPSIWAHAALLRGDAFDQSQWNCFVREILAAGQVRHGLTGDSALSGAAAGWLLWLLAFLRRRRPLDSREEELWSMCLNQLDLHRGAFLAEGEDYEIPHGRVESGPGLRVQWIHPAASAVSLGAIGVVKHSPAAWRVMGASTETLMQFAANGVDGHLRDYTTEQEGALPFVYPTIYGLWAFCESVQLLSGALIDKAGLLVVTDRKLLLVLKRGTTQLILPGGKPENGESMEDALVRETEEELGCRPTNLEYFSRFEDEAANEQGATIRIEAYLGQLTREPRPAAEIVSCVWADSQTDSASLSPIVRNHILPALTKAKLVL